MNYKCAIIKYDMKRLRVILLICLFMLVPSIVCARCDYNEKSNLQALASNLGFSYNYTETDEGINSKVKFSITVTNMRPEIYVVDQSNVRVYYYNNSNEFTINNYNPGTTTRFIVYGNVGECKGVELLNNYVTLPPYNRFYKDNVCIGANGYKLCNRWIMNDLSYNEFVKKVEEYKLSVRVEPSLEEEKNIIEMIMDFLSKYSFYLFGGIILVCSGLIIYLKRKDDFDLE